MAIVVETRYWVPEFDDLGFDTRYRCRAVPRSTTFRQADTLFSGGFIPLPEGIPDEVREQASEVLASFDCRMPAGTKILKDALIVEVVPESGSRWRREFPRIEPEHFHVGLYGTPAPDQLLVATGDQGWLINAGQPDVVLELVVAPVLGVRRVPGHPVLLCWSFSDLAAYGPAGLLWNQEGLSLDDLRIVDVSANLVRGTTLVPAYGPDPYIPDEHVPFALDPLTGQLVRP